MNKKAKYIIIGMVILIALVAGIYIKIKVTANAIQEQKDYEEWLKDNCNCTEKEKIKCSEGYEYVGGFCRFNTALTNPVLTCSQFDCTGETVNWNYDKEKWSPVINN